MRKSIFIVSMTVLFLLGCKESKKPAKDYIQESTEKLLSIDDICKVEDIIADSSLMNAQGDTVWRKVNDQLIRIKMGDKYYLRKETKDGSVTNYTYRYD